MAERKVQCGICKEKFPKNELIQRTKTQRVCKKCHETKAREIEEYNELIKFICQGFGQTAPTAFQLKNIKKFKEEYGYSYKTIQCIIYYMYVVEQVKTYDNNLGLVPYYHDKAQNHFQMIENAKKSAKKISHEEIVVFTNPQRESRLDKTRLVDISSII